MQTKWKVIFRQDGKLRLRRFQDDLESAMAFYKERRATGEETHLVSANKAFPPYKPGHKRYEERPSSKYLWCPYCIKWRAFVFTALRMDGILGEPRNRCPICTIPITDYWVRKYNGMTEHVDMEALKKSVGAWA